MDINVMGKQKYLENVIKKAEVTDTVSMGGKNQKIINFDSCKISSKAYRGNSESMNYY
jgi:hypothetical protein